MTVIMETHYARLSGQWVAECPACHMVCPYWDEEDLNDDGQLECGNCRTDCTHDWEWDTADEETMTCTHCQATQR